MKPRGFLFLLVCICLLGPATRLPAQTTFQRTYGDTLPDHGRSVAQIADGGYIITGETGPPGAGSFDVWLIRTDVSGDTMWTRTYGGAYRDRGCSVAQTADGGYVITGLTRSFGAGQNDVYLIKTNSDGNAPAIAEP